MKPIVLTKEHESKLLEMCNELFMFDFKIIKNNIKIFNIEGTHYTTIHWFEFCMEICQKLALEYKQIAIQNNFNYVTVHYKYWNDDKLKIHPIDYLYEEFKKRLES